MLRSFLLLPCLLICLACATPFPIESLEEGMTAEAVRAEFGEPESTAEWPNAIDESRQLQTILNYTDEKKFWPALIMP